MPVLELSGGVAMMAVAMVLLVVALGCLLVDRSARRSAWRRIAEERRWNREHGERARGD